MTDDQEGPPELCDGCGAVLAADERTLYRVVPDSSAVHATDPRPDGNRLLTVCCQEHMDELVAQYEKRLFVGAELWAGQIDRALARHPEGLDQDSLAAEAGLSLSPDQIQLGVKWRVLGARAWFREYGEDGPGSPGSGAGS